MLFFAKIIDILLFQCSILNKVAWWRRVLFSSCFVIEMLPSSSYKKATKFLLNNVLDQAILSDTLCYGWDLSSKYTLDIYYSAYRSLIIHYKRMVSWRIKDEEAIKIGYVLYSNENWSCQIWGHIHSFDSSLSIHSLS